MKRKSLLFGIVCAALGLVLWFLCLRPEKVEYDTSLSELAERPDWSVLSKYDGVLTKDELISRVRDYYSVGDAWENDVKITDEEAEFYHSDGTVSVSLARSSSMKQPSRYWRAKRELEPRSETAPLAGLHIVLDPGHIGGKCAKMEERWFQIDEGLPVMEGEMALLVAMYVRDELRNLGARVSLTRQENEPVGRQRSPHFRALAEAKVERLGLDPALTKNYQEKLFYRTAEIRARAHKINEELKPDLVVALHFNAEAWGDPENPSLTDQNHFHILLNGAYTEGEFRKEDQRLEMWNRIFQGTIEEEISLSKAMVRSFKKHTLLPGYQYEKNSKRAIPIDNEGYIWARNLLANRLYGCPVIFLEPYVMNSEEVYVRVQLGDYEGTREIGGIPRKSIFREYSDAVTEGLVEYYKQ